MFGAPVAMKPEAKGNRMTAKLNVSKSNALCRGASKTVGAYVAEIVAEAG